MAHISGTNTGAALPLLTQSGASCIIPSGAFTTYLDDGDLVALQRSGLLGLMQGNGRLTGVGASRDDGRAFASSVVAARLMSVGPVAAKSTTAVHALYDGVAAAFPGPFTNPDVPRNLRVTKSASWDGGTITVSGTNQFDELITEVFNADVETTVGVKIFKTVTGAVKSIPAGVTGNGASIGTGDALGTPRRLADTVAQLAVDDVAEAVTVEATYDSFAPTTVPADTTYVLLGNVYQ